MRPLLTPIADCSSPGMLEGYLPNGEIFGAVDPDTLTIKRAEKDKKRLENKQPPLDSLLNLDESEEAATNQIARKAWAH